MHSSGTGSRSDGKPSHSSRGKELASMKYHHTSKQLPKLQLVNHVKIQCSPTTVGWIVTAGHELHYVVHMVNWIVSLHAALAGNKTDNNLLHGWLIICKVTTIMNR